ncbi:DUF5667 domain-containing protein [Amycolatopsis taiwanensis]|uniref:DUF5667 domain-containing protein n=1 Tax=Amycolatopsis taiwanensis TaxID=342230 RepID=UPI0012EBC943|nr:DUF5667 domain-containing protein [Amycolatopsis taiwanensis]
MPGWSPRELEVMSALRDLGDTATLDPPTRKELRARIDRRLREAERRRRCRWLAGAAALLIALIGLGMVLSRNALPGDPLYAVKRATESAELGLTFGDEAKATAHLRFAATRLDELLALHAARGSTIADFEREVRAGTTELTTLGVRGAGRELDDLRSWVRRQSAKAAPFAEVTDLLGRVSTRARALSVRLGCDRITSGESDDLGVLPAPGVCWPPTPSSPSLPRPVTPVTPVTPNPPTAVGFDDTRSSESVSTPAPTAPVPSVIDTGAPAAFNPPILAPTSARAPATTTSPPPLLSVPPLIPGLPGVRIG